MAAWIIILSSLILSTSAKAQNYEDYLSENFRHPALIPKAPLAQNAFADIAPRPQPQPAQTRAPSSPQDATPVAAKPSSPKSNETDGPINN